MEAYGRRWTSSTKQVGTGELEKRRGRKARCPFRKLLSFPLVPLRAYFHSLSLSLFIRLDNLQHVFHSLCQAHMQVTELRRLVDNARTTNMRPRRGHLLQPQLRKRCQGSECLRMRMRVICCGLKIQSTFTHSTKALTAYSEQQNATVFRFTSSPT